MTQNIKQCTSCQNLSKRLKVLQADYDFEIKKLNEDKSTEKALYELSTNREIKKLQEKCQKQKEQRQKQNESWMHKYDEQISRQKQQMHHYKLQKDHQLQDFKKHKNDQMKKFQQQTVEQLKKTIQTLTLEKENLKIDLTKRYQKEISELKTDQQDRISKLILKHEETLKKKCGQYDATILGLSSEKTVEENLHKKTKEQSKSAQSRLHQEIYSLKRNIIDHEENIVRLKTQIHEKCNKIQTLHSQMHKRQNEYSEQYSKLLAEYDQKYESHKKSMQINMDLLFKKQLQNCSKYEKALQKIQEHREMQNQMYKANINQIKSCVDDRPSRLEDVEEIIKLRQKLIKKQKETQALSDELRWYRLELQNKEETYNKIFGPETKNNQSVFVRRKDLKMKRGGKSVTSVREVLGSVNLNPNLLAPLVGGLEKKLLPPKQTKIL